MATKSPSVVARSGGGIDSNMAGGSFGDDGYILYLDLRGSYGSVGSCQNSLDCVLKMGAFDCLQIITQ